MPRFSELGAGCPAALTEIYPSFIDDDAMLNMLLQERPPVVSFHFGIPPQERIAALHDAGIFLLAKCRVPFGANRTFENSFAGAWESDCMVTSWQRTGANYEGQWDGRLVELRRCISQSAKSGLLR